MTLAVDVRGCEQFSRDRDVGGRTLRRNPPEIVFTWNLLYPAQQWKMCVRGSCWLGMG